MFYWLLALVFFSSLCWSPAVSRVIQKRAAFYIANETMCIVDGDVYRNGDPVPTDDECERCTCRPPGFSCVLRDCDTKPGCKAVRKAGECCPEYVCGCVHNNRLYEDGELIKDLQNNCYTCRCHGSSISCTFADCHFRGDCPPEYVPGECCPRYDHCPPLSTTTTTTTTTSTTTTTTTTTTPKPTTMIVIQQEEVDFLNKTTQHLENFVTEGITPTVVSVETTPFYDLISVTFTLSGEKISSIHDYDVTKLTTLLPVQTVKYKETTKHISVPFDSEYTTLEGGLFVDGQDKTTTEHLDQSTTDLDTVPVLHTTSEEPQVDVQTALGTDESESATFESDYEIRTTHDASSFDNDSKLLTDAQDTRTEVTQLVHLTSDSGQASETNQQESIHAETGPDSTESYSVKESSQKPLVIHEDQTASTEYLAVSTEDSLDLKSPAIGFTDTTKHVETADHSEIDKTLDSTEDDLHASSGEFQSVTAVLFPESSKSTELDTDGLYSAENQTEHVQKSTAGETSDTTSLESHTSAAEHETETTESSKIATYDELPASTFIQTFTIPGQKNESSTHEETDDDIMTKITDSEVTFDSSRTAAPSDIIPEVTYDHEEESNSTSKDIESTEILTTQGSLDIESVSHLDGSKFKGPEDTTPSSLETTFNVDVSVMTTERNFSDYSTDATISHSSSIHSFEELDSSEDDLNVTLHDIKSATATIPHSTENIQTSEAIAESTTASIDLSTISHKHITAESSAELTYESTFVNRTDDDTSSYSYNNISSEITTIGTTSISYSPESYIHSNDSAVSQDSDVTISETKQTTGYISSTPETTEDLSHEESSKILASTEVSESEELLTPKTISSTGSELNTMTSSKTQDVDAFSQEVTSEIYTAETATDKTTESDILYSKESEINTSTKTFDEAETTSKAAIDQETELLATRTDGSEMKPTITTEEFKEKGTHTDDSTTSISGVDSDPVASTLEDLASFPDLDKKINANHTTIHALTQDTETSTQQAESTSPEVSKTSLPAQESLEHVSHSESFTDKQNTEYITIPTVSADVSTTEAVPPTTEAIESDVIVEKVHDTQLFATRVRTTSQTPEPSKITSLKPEQLPTTPESDLPSEIPEFEPPLANILKQQMLFNKPTTKKSSIPTSIPPDRIQESQSNPTTDQNDIVKLSLTLDESGENDTSLMPDESEIFVLNHEYTIPDSEIISYGISNTSEEDHLPEETENPVDLEEENHLLSTVNDQKSTVSIGTSTSLTNISESDNLTPLISNTDAMDSEYLYNETAHEEISDVDFEVSESTNLLPDTLEEKHLPHPNHDMENNLLNNLSHENSTYGSQGNEHGSEEINNFVVSTTTNENIDDSADTVSVVSSSDAQTEHTLLVGNEMHATSDSHLHTTEDKNNIEDITLASGLITEDPVNESNETLDENISLFESEDSLHGHDNPDDSLPSHSETSIEYQDSEKTENPNDHKEISTTSLEELHPEVVSTNEEAIVTEDYNIKSTEPEDKRNEQSTTVKVNVFFGHDFLEGFNEPAHHSSVENIDDNLNENLNNRYIPVNSEIKILDTDEKKDDDFAESEKEVPEESVPDKEPDLANSSEKGFDNSVLDAATTSTTSNLPNEHLSHDASLSENESVSEDSISTAEDSSSPFTILEYLGELFSDVSTFSTMSDLNQSKTTQNELSNVTSDSENISHTDDELSNNSFLPNRTYSSLLKDKFAEYGSLGGVFITGESKYNKSDLNENDQNAGEEKSSTSMLTENTGSSSSDNDYETHSSSSQDNTTSVLEGEEYHYETTSKLSTEGFTEKREDETEDNEKEKLESSETSDESPATVVDSEIVNESETTNQGTMSDTSEMENVSTSTSAEIQIHRDSENAEDPLLTRTEIKEEGGPEKGGEWFEPKDPDLTLAIPANEQHVSNATTLSNSEEEDHLATETNVDHGPEKGGEVFEPSFPEIFPISSGSSAAENEQGLNNESSNSAAEHMTQESALTKNISSSTFSSNKTEAVSEVNTDSDLNLDIIPPLPILLRDFNKHDQKNKTDYVNNTSNSDEDYILNEEVTTMSSKSSGRSFNHPFHMSDIISQVFKAPGYDSEINVDHLKTFGSLKKSQVLRRLKRVAEPLPEMKALTNTEAAISDSYSPSNKDSINSPSQDANPINDKNILLVEGYAYKPADYFPIRSSFIIVHSDEDSEDNETGIDSKRKAAVAPNEGDVSEAKLLDDISPENSGYA